MLTIKIDKLNELVRENFIYHFVETEWDSEIFLMEKSGAGFARMYWFADDDNEFYMNWLSVNPEHRKKGLGLKLQEIRESIGKEMGFKKVILSVDKNSWMRQWYKRRGFKYLQVCSRKYNTVWLVKIL